MSASPEDIDLDDVAIPRSVRVNLWIANHVWTLVAGLLIAVMAIVFSLVIVIGRVKSNAESVSELKYKSCIEDSVLVLTVAQGELVDAAFSRDTDRAARDLIPYRDALEQLRQAKVVCRAQFPG